MVEKLLSFPVIQESGLNEGDASGRTPFHYASMNGNLKLLQLLLACGSKLSTANSRDVEGKSPFYLACEQGKHEIVEYLLSLPDKIWGVNELDIQGKSAFYAAVEQIHDKVVRILLASERITSEVLNGTVSECKGASSSGGVKPVCRPIQRARLNGRQVVRRKMLVPSEIAAVKRVAQLLETCNRIDKDVSDFEDNDLPDVENDSIDLAAAPDSNTKTVLYI